MYQLYFKLDTLPKSLNKTLRANRWQNHKQNKLWDQLVWMECRDLVPPIPLDHARIRIIRHFYRFLDYDGLVGSMKPIVDGLIDCGVLKDDSWKTLGIWDVTQRFRPKDQGPLLEVWVEDACHN